MLQPRNLVRVKDEVSGVTILFLKTQNDGHSPSKGNTKLANETYTKPFNTRYTRYTPNN